MTAEESRRLSECFKYLIQDKVDLAIMFIDGEMEQSLPIVIREMKKAGATFDYILGQMIDPPPTAASAEVEAPAVKIANSLPDGDSTLVLDVPAPSEGNHGVVTTA